MHAYLILAHNEFGILQHLISALDDKRNDIYVHIDAKVRELPELIVHRSGLMVIEDRIKTFWGDVSLMEAEYKLLQAAYKRGGYEYYHIISGVHFPLKSQNVIHEYFEGIGGKSVLSYMDTSEKEIHYKFGRYHFFVKSQSGKFKKTCNLLWRLFLLAQKPFPERNVEAFTNKRSQWCSLSEEAVACLIDHKEDARRMFRRSLCCDEFFVPTVLSMNSIGWTESNMLFMKFRIYSPKVLEESDYDDIMNSGSLFARKFTSGNGLVNKIEKCL